MCARIEPGLCPTDISDKTSNDSHESRTKPLHRVTQIHFLFPVTNIWRISSEISGIMVIQPKRIEGIFFNSGEKGRHNSFILTHHYMSSKTLSAVKIIICLGWRGRADFTIEGFKLLLATEFSVILIPLLIPFPTSHQVDSLRRREKLLSSASALIS